MYLSEGAIIDNKFKLNNKESNNPRGRQVANECPGFSIVSMINRTPKDATERDYSKKKTYSMYTS